MATYSTARHSQGASSLTPESAPSLAFRPPRVRFQLPGGAAHPEQSRRVERGAALFCQYISPCPHPHPSSPVIPRLREGSRTCPITPFLAPIRHSGRREPESIPGEGPLTLSKVEGSSGGRPSSANKSRSPCTSTPAPCHPEVPRGIRGGVLSPLPLRGEG